ncbi:uncharacterized protein EV420DRAFT_1015382 [Desarmillaria tabescens]|uniref:Uncharacterized protein n=1 Tax=Armillaria tabescens TaxID=1929756 RepID=A0AA39JJR5_ARMTA|nr:uncharacterized protein EV420DRAFT_1015382 [Desarmillaria tabescens]KAK0443933.1 hypothetical protein EV420DRAFT_1015382 [Desarmillaria tabescens]
MFWFLTLSSTVLVSVSQFFVMMRAYRLWDHKPTVRRVLPFVFVACITGALVLSVMTVLTFLKTQIELPPELIVCAVTGVPKTIPSTIGILLSFNVLVILISFYNALENPRRYESEVFDSLRRDGSRIYLLISLLYVPPLIASLVTDILVFFPMLILASSLKVNLTSRMQLRVESLSLSDTLHPVARYTVQESY